MHAGSGAGRGAPLAVGERWPHAGAWCAFLGRRARARAIRSRVRNTREGLAAQPALSLPRWQDLALGQDGECRQQDAEQAVRRRPGRAGTGVPSPARTWGAPRLADSRFSCVSFCFQT